MADAPEETGDAQVSFKVKTSGDRSHNITMAESATVLDLKNKLATEDLENIPADRQRLIYSGRVMKNDDALSVYKIKAGNTIHLVKSAASNPARPAPSSSAAAATPAVPTNMAAGTSASNPLAGLTGARYAGHVPLPSADLFGPDGGMNPPSEEQMAEMLSNPQIQQSMNEALQNPDFVNFMIQSNPMLRNLPNAREIVQSPQFRHMMTDAESLRMASRMRRMFGGPGGAGGAGAFPAPGATNSTPDGAPASTEGGAANNAAGQGVPPMPFGFPGMFGMPQGGDAAANPFAALFNPQAGQQAAAGQGTNADSGNPASGGAAAGQMPNADALGALFGGAGGAGGAAGANPFASPEFQSFLQAMQAGGGGFGGAPAAPPDNRPPEERYAEQLRQLNDMGFFDFERNVAALRRSGGSVQGAIEHLLSG